VPRPKKVAAKEGPSTPPASAAAPSVQTADEQRLAAQLAAADANNKRYLSEHKAALEKKANRAKAAKG
jgi:hypothetical protein